MALRAAVVPFTHDEARTFFVYTLGGEFLPGLSHWDAGNHPLCTALGWISFKAFGMAALVLRSANVLAFLLYAWYAWRMGAWVRDALVRWCLWTALLLAPVLIEFFALYRGYGLGMAFLLMALYHTVQAVRTGGGLHTVAALVAWMLAGSAMLSLLIVWCAGSFLLLLAVLTRPMRMGKRVALCIAWLSVGLLPVIAAAMYGGELKVRGLLYYGTPDGLVMGTFRSVATMLFGAEAGWTVWALLLCVLVVLAVVVMLVFQQPRAMRNEPVTALAIVFMAELLGRLVLGEGFGVLYPEGRTVLHWVPMLVALTALAVDAVGVQRSALTWSALVLLVLPLRTLATANVSYTAIWPEEAISTNILDSAARQQVAMGRPLLIDGYRQMPPQWDFERLRQYPKLAPLASSGFPQTDCDLLLIDTTYFHAPPGFHTIATSASGRQVLKARMAPLQFALMKDSVLTPVKNLQEYTTLWEPVATDMLGMELVLDLELVLRSNDPSLATLLVIEVDGANGEHLHYDPLELRTLQRAWTGDTLHLLRRIPTLAGNTRRAVCYLWDQRRQNVELAHARIRTLRIQPDNDLRNP